MGDTSFSGGWIFAFLIIALIFGGGGFGFGNNAAYATMADVNAAINNQSVQSQLNSALLSSANNNYETAQLISNQNMQMMNQQNSNLVNAIQGLLSLKVNSSPTVSFEIARKDFIFVGIRKHEKNIEVVFYKRPPRYD